MENQHHLAGHWIALIVCGIWIVLGCIGLGLARLADDDRGRTKWYNALLIITLGLLSFVFAASELHDAWSDTRNQRGSYLRAGIAGFFCIQIIFGRIGLD